jgi:uncharacterized Ntn-hydrolase superfamily protein/outer membrane protein assembly factor BamB
MHNQRWLAALAMGAIAFGLAGGTILFNSQGPRPQADIIPVSGAAHPLPRRTSGQHVIATFSIVAADPQTGICGAAVASKYPAVGKVVPHARAGVGAFCTQYWGKEEWGEPALDLLEQGKTPEEVLATLLRTDPQPEKRQLAIIDAKGRAANRNPSGADASANYWGGMSGRYYACQGNTLAGRDVIVAMSAAYEETAGSLADRLMAALIAGDCAGGDHRGRLAAGIRVAKPDDKDYWLELYVDESDDAVIELARKYSSLTHAAKGNWPGGKPPFQHPCKDRPDVGALPPSAESATALRSRRADLLPVAATQTGPADGEDWPRWRGRRGDGTWKAPQLPDKWPDEGLSSSWQQQIGGGYAGVVVTAGRAFTMDYQKQPEQSEGVLAFDARTGKPLWSHRYPVDYGDMDHANGPRSTPTVFEGRLYAFGAVGHLHSLEVATGNVLWKEDCRQNLDARVPEWGCATSPLIFQDLVIVQVGAEPNGGVVAFERKTGHEVWRNLTDEPGYATPILIDSAGTQQLVCWTPSHICGLNPGTGEMFWKIPFEVTYGTSIATPIFRNKTVLVSNYWEGTKAIELGKEATQADVAWEDRRNLRGLMSQPLYREGYVYLLDKGHGLTCVEFKTGEKIWDDDNQMTPRGRNPQAAMVWTGEADRALVLNSDGELILARFSPAGYVEQSRTAIIGSTWAHPAFAGTSVYARSDSELVCVPLTPADGTGR